MYLELCLADKHYLNQNMRNKLYLLGGLTIISFGANAQFWDFTDPVKIGGTVNTEAEESIPVFSKDSSKLYFVRQFDKANKGDATDQDIWYSTRDESGAYIESKLLSELNNKYNNSIVGLSKDGNKMYLLNSYEGKKDTEKGIAVSDLKGSSWSAPVAIEIPGLDIDGEFYGFHVSENGEAIIISYNGAGSKGEEDLYVSTKSGSGWSAPIHMGSTINSKGFEISPFLTKSMDTLFFSSDGFGGEGDADIFYSVRLGDSWTNWSEPINLGDRINSEKFDAYFIHSGSQAYWSSNRDAERSDIYMINILTPPPLYVSCVATDVTSYQGTDGSIDATIEGGAPPFKYNWTNGFYGEDQGNLATGEYTLTVTDNVGQVASTSCYVDEPAKPIDPVVVTTYPNPEFMHYFGYNKNKLSAGRGEFKRFVKEIEEQLEDGRRSITINIYSSASNVPTKTFESNEKLAQTRAENMKYDLIEHFSKKTPEAQVNVVIVESKVQGPLYEDDSSNRDKYEPFQYVQLKTE